MQTSTSVGIQKEMSASANVPIQMDYIGASAHGVPRATPTLLEAASLSSQASDVLPYK
jgi:hypothetical protein